MLTHFIFILNDVVIVQFADGYASIFCFSTIINLFCGYQGNQEAVTAPPSSVYSKPYLPLLADLLLFAHSQMVEVPHTSQ